MQTHKLRVRRSDILWAAAFYLITIVTFAILFFIARNPNQKSFNQPMDWFDCFYLSVTTITTTGYGDIYPTSHLARFTAMLEMLVGVFINVTLFATISNNLFVRLETDKQP